MTTEHTTDAGTPYLVETDRRETPDGTSLFVRLFRPAGAGGDPVETPVLLQRTPYGAPDRPAGPVATGALDRGYTVAYEDTRGRGASDGAFEPWIHEAEDGASAVEWLAGRPWSTGSVATFGQSSAGQLQLLAAAEQPSGLAAIAPTFTPSDLHRADFFQDGAMSALTLVTWSFDWVARDTLERLVRAGRLSDEEAKAVERTLDDALDDVPALVAQRPLVDLPTAVLGDALPSEVDPDEVVPHWEAWTSRPTYDDFWRSFDPEPRYDRIDVPGLHVTGWYELCQQGTLTTYRALSPAPAPQHLVVGPWAHLDTTSAVGALEFGPAASATAAGLWETQLDFFDTYVRGTPRGRFALADDGGPDGHTTTDTATTTTTTPLVETFRTTVTSENGESAVGGGEWVRHAEWPPADAVVERWHLRSGGAAATSLDDGRLTRTPPDKFEAIDEWTHDPDDPVPTCGGPLCCREEAWPAGPFDQRAVEARPDVLTFTTEPFETAVDLAGPVTATVTVATTAQDTDVVATLVHVTAGGPAYNLCEGIRRARYRHGRDRVAPVPQDEPMRVGVNLWDVHHRLPAGDRLRLELASSNHPRFDPHPGTTEPWRSRRTRTARQTLWHERDRESVLELTRRR